MTTSRCDVISMLSWPPFNPPHEDHCDVDFNMKSHCPLFETVITHSFMKGFQTDKFTPHSPKS